MFRRIKLTPIFVLTASFLPACGAGEAEPASAIHQSLAEAEGVRNIPVDILIMAPAGSSNPLTHNLVLKAIATANQVYQSLPLQFYARSELRVTTQYLHDLSQTGTLTWTQVKSDAGQLGIDANAFPASNATTRAEWLSQIAKLRGPNAIPVFVAMNWSSGSNCSSPFPHDDGFNWQNQHPVGTGWTTDHSHGIQCVPNADGINALAHEFGHYLGLFHTHEVLLTDALSTEGQTPSDYYDLVYRSLGAGIEVYGSKSDVDAHVGTLKIKDNGTSQSLNNVVGCGDPTWNPQPCEFSNQFENGVGGTVTYRTSLNPAEMAGITAPPATSGAKYFMNVMSYNFCSKCPLFLSGSQKKLVYKSLASMKGQRQMLADANAFGPAASSWGTNRLDVFWHNAQDQLAVKTYDNGWGAVNVVATSEMASDPTAVSWGSNRRDVFWRGVDDHLKHIWNTGSGSTGWTAEEDLGGTLTSSPAVTSWGSGRLDVFWRGADWHLKHKWYPNGAGWSGEEDLGGLLYSDPAAVSWGSGRLDVFWRGATGHLMHKVFSGTWSGAQDHGGSLVSAPAVASWGSGRLDVFWRGSDQTLRHIWYPYGADWSSEENLGGVLESDPAAVSWSSNRLDVFWASSNRLRHIWYPYNNAWSFDENLAGLQVTY